jgi:hypothetical protein
MRHLTRLFRLVALASLLVLTQRSAANSGPGISPRVLEHRDEARSLGLFRERQGAFAPAPLLDTAARSPQAPLRVWVFFTDKGLGTRSDLDRALDTFRSGLIPEARERRRVLGPDLGANFTDLPVNSMYLDALRAAGFQVHRASRWVNAASITIPGARLAELESMPFVRYVQPVLEKHAPIPDLDQGQRTGSRPGDITPYDAAVACTTAVGDSVEAWFYGPAYNQLGQIQALQLHRLGYSGAGVRVMVLDTGFLKTHPAFAKTHIVAEWDFVNEDGNTSNEGADNPMQDDHGTGTWGVAGGYAPGALIGPAFAADFVLAKTEDVTQEVHAEEDNYVAALEWGDGLGVSVTTASLAYFTFDSGGSYTTAQLDGDTAVITKAVDLAAAKGIACVNAMGNSGPSPSSLETPADADSVIAVGAVDTCGTIASFSSRGPTADSRIKPEIVARGVATYWAKANTLNYGAASGTSLSTPLIGGLTALLKEAHPTWSGYQIRVALMATGTMSGSPNNTYGWGVAQGLAAMNSGPGTQPPRMTLPFKLLAPAKGAFTRDVTPTLRWTKSKAVIPGDQATYRIIHDDDATFASPETIQVGTDTTYTFPIGLPPGTVHWWKVEAVGNLGYVRRSMNTHYFVIDGTVAVNPPETVTPRFLLGRAAPNPTHGVTRFAVRAPEGSRVAVEVISVSGRLLKRFDLTGDGAEHLVSWDGTDAQGARVPAGMYFYRLAGVAGIPARKILVIG